MADLQVRRTNDTGIVTGKEWDPFAAMRGLMQWDPFRDLRAAPMLDDTTFLPAFDIKETKDQLVFHADVPGIQERDLDVTVSGNRLTVRGKRDVEHREEKDTYYLYERNHGTFVRTFSLPDGVDASTVHADLKDGVLMITVAKRVEQQSKKIPIQTL
ncbi:MAG: Hsp20/alpha crystallin family protein, partial [Polyangiales bacterium]